jgi:hypothetical protein
MGDKDIRKKTLEKGRRIVVKEGSSILDSPEWSRGLTRRWNISTLTVPFIPSQSSRPIIRMLKDS